MSQEICSKFEFGNKIFFLGFYFFITQNVLEAPWSPFISISLQFVINENLKDFLTNSGDIVFWKMARATSLYVCIIPMTYLMEIIIHEYKFQAHSFFKSMNVARRVLRMYTWRVKSPSNEKKITLIGIIFWEKSDLNLIIVKKNF